MVATFLFSGAFGAPPPSPSETVQTELSTLSLKARVHYALAFSNLMELSSQLEDALEPLAPGPVSSANAATIQSAFVALNAEAARFKRDGLGIPKTSQLVTQLTTDMGRVSTSYVELRAENRSLYEVLLIVHESGELAASDLLDQK